MSKPAFYRRGSHTGSLVEHHNDLAGGRMPTERRYRPPQRKSTVFPWSRLLLGGLALVVVALFAIVSWQMPLTTDAGGSLDSLSSNDGRERPGRSAGRVLRFFPPGRALKFEEHRRALDRRRSERSVGHRKPRLALVIEDTSRNSNLLMLVTLVKSLMDLGYTFMVFMLEKNQSHFLWETIGCQLSVIDSQSSGSIVWSEYEGIIVNSLEGRKVILRLMQEPFISVPLVWVVHEDTLGKRLSHYAELGWQDLISEWRNSFNRADAVVFPDFSLPMLYSLLDNGNFFVIPGYPVDIWETNNHIASHTRDQLREDFEFSNNDLLILIIGNSFVYNDLPWYEVLMHDSIHQVKRLVELSRIIKYVFLCGNSTDASSSTLQEVASRMGFPDGSVRQYGMDHDVKNILLMADIVLYWSYDTEQSFPPLLLQAMSLGIPIVASNMTVIKKYVADGIHGFLFDPSIPNTLDRAFSLLIEDKKLTNTARSVASHGKLLSMYMLASEFISAYADLFENILNFPSHFLLPNSISQVQQKTWLWNLLDIEINQNNNNSRKMDSIERSGISIVYLVEEEFSRKLIEKVSPQGKENDAEDIPTLSDWKSTDEMKDIENFESQEIQELDERMERTWGLWEDVYRTVRRAEKVKVDDFEPDEGELERTGNPVCIYEAYTGKGAWPFLHGGSIYRGLALSFKSGRSKSDDVDAVRRLPVLKNTYYRDILCETGAMFAVANRLDEIHKLPWIGFQSWRASGTKVALSSIAENMLEQTLQGQSKGDIIYYWAVMGQDLDKAEENRTLDFWSMCDDLNDAQCRVGFESAFRHMYGLPPDMPALPPMPSDGGYWSILHSWVMPTSSFLEFIMFTRMFTDSLHILNRNNSGVTSCILGSSKLEKRHCYCRVLELSVNVWAYHSGRRMVYLDPLSGELKEQHPFELREMWLKYFNLDLLKSMDEDLAEKAEDGMHPGNNRWLWPLTGEVHWPGTLGREREERLKVKMDKKKRTREKLLVRHRHGYKQKSLGQ